MGDSTQMRKCTVALTVYSNARDYFKLQSFMIKKMLKLINMYYKDDI